MSVLTTTEKASYDTAVTRSASLDAIPNPVASRTMNSQKITGLADGTAAQDAATFNMLRTVRSPIAKAHADSPYSLASSDEILQLDTSTGTIQVNLPAPSGKQIVMIKDVGGAASTSNITLHRNGAEKIENVAGDKTLTLNYGAWLVWSDGTNWWISGSY